MNTYWTFDTKQATAVQTGAGTWQVTLEVEAHKVIADSAGDETEMPMNEWVEIGIFAPAGPGERGGIDPYNLLDWEEGDNIEPIDPVAARPEAEPKRKKERIV